VPIPANAGDFRLLDRCVVDALKSLPERNRFMKGLYAWVGFRTVAVAYEPNERFAGESSFSMRGLSRSRSPASPRSRTRRCACGAQSARRSPSARCSAASGSSSSTTPWAPTSRLGDAGRQHDVLQRRQLLSIGILGEYVGRIFDEVKQRPVYLVRHDSGPSESAGRAVVSARGRVVGVCADDAGLSTASPRPPSRWRRRARERRLVRDQRFRLARCGGAARVVAMRPSSSACTSTSAKGVPLSAALRAHWPTLPGLARVLAQAHLRPVPLAAIGAEFAAQVDAFAGAIGGAPAFVDGHQHVHATARRAPHRLDADRGPGRDARLAQHRPRPRPGRRVQARRDRGERRPRAASATSSRAASPTTARCSAPTTFGADYRPLMQAWLAERPTRAACCSAIRCAARRGDDPIDRGAPARGATTSRATTSAPTCAAAGVTVGAAWRREAPAPVDLEGDDEVDQRRDDLRQQVVRAEADADGDEREAEHAPTTAVTGSASHAERRARPRNVKRRCRERDLARRPRRRARRPLRREQGRFDEADENRVVRRGGDRADGRHTEESAWPRRRFHHARRQPRPPSSRP
jgi:hypothetical protein